MTKKERFDGVLSWFRTHMPVAETELNYQNPFQLLVAVILSAQCTDKRVNLYTPLLFQCYPTPEKMAQAEVFEIFELIKSISFPNSKAKYLVGMAQMLCLNFNGEVPSDIKDLQKLPGVGRKTANVIASVVFNQATMAVDTHVFRISNRIGLTQSTTTLACEKQLVKYIPEQEIAIAHHWLILHGRYVCVARKPKCNICEIQTYCKWYSNNIA